MNSFPTISVSVCGPLRESYLFKAKPVSIRSTQDNVERERAGEREREKLRNRELFGEWRKREILLCKWCVCVCVCFRGSIRSHLLLM